MVFIPAAASCGSPAFDGPDVYSWKVLGEKEVDAYRERGLEPFARSVSTDGLFQCFCNEAAGVRVLRHDTVQCNGQSRTGQVPAYDGPVQTVRGRWTEGQRARQPVRRDIVRSAGATNRHRHPGRGQHPADALDRSRSSHRAESADSGQSCLHERARQLERQAKRLRELAQAVQAESVVQQLSEIVRIPLTIKRQPRQRLISSMRALLLAAIDNNELDIDGYREQVDEMADELGCLLVPADPSEYGKDADPAQPISSMRWGYHGSPHQLSQCIQQLSQ